jgi:hypothetical protein
MATGNPTPTDENVQAFSIEQNKALWAEIAEDVKESRLLERYAVIGMSAYWAFLVKDGKIPLTGQNYLEWILIPALLAILGGLRSMALLSRLTLIGRYLREKEGSMGYPGWETFLQSSYRKRSKPFLASGTVIWICILLMSVLVPVLFHYFGFVASAGLPHQP